jgi:hypothetical protein
MNTGINIMSDPFSLVFLGGGILVFAAFFVIFTLAATGLTGKSDDEQS